MSPEQRTAQSVNAATDQYAFGVMAFEILTGDLPFTGTVQEVLHAHLVEAPPSLRERRKEISPSIEALVHRMLAKQPTERFPSLRDAERAFRALVPDEGGTTQIIAGYSHVQAATAAGSVVTEAPKIPKLSGLVSNSVTASSSAPTVRSEKVAAPAPASSKSQSKLIAAAVAAVLLVGAGIVWKTTQAQSDAAPTTPIAAGAPAVAQPAATAANPAGESPTAAAPAQKSAGPNSNPVRVDKPVAGAPPPANTNAAAEKTATTPARAPAPARVDSSPPRAAVVAPAPTEAAPAVEKPAAAIADARKIGRDFVTMLNQQRYRELAQVPQHGGDAALRAELIRLVQNAPDFAAGFDRIASPPAPTADGFATDFVLDLQWKGGSRLLLVQAYATMQNGTWHLAGFGAEAPR
jgi:serine/threonine-protein kinase